MLLDKPLRLCAGKGNGVDSACLMTATNMLIGRGGRGDEAVCVCSVLRSFIIPTNDCMPDHLRHELYGPLPWSLVGTKTDNIGVMVRRAEILSEASKELAKSAKSARSAAYAAESAEYAEYAAESAAKYTAYAEYAAKSAAEAAAYAACVAYAAKSAAKSAAEAAACAACVAYAAYAEYAAKSAAKYTAEAAAKSAESRRIWTLCRDALVRAIAVGNQQPVEIVLTPERLCEAIK